MTEKQKDYLKELLVKILNFEKRIEFISSRADDTILEDIFDEDYVKKQNLDQSFYALHSASQCLYTNLLIFMLWLKNNEEINDLQEVFELQDKFTYKDVKDKNFKECVEMIKEIRYNSNNEIKTNGGIVHSLFEFEEKLVNENNYKKLDEYFQLMVDNIVLIRRILNIYFND